MLVYWDLAEKVQQEPSREGNSFMSRKLTYPKKSGPLKVDLGQSPNLSSSC